MSSMKTPDNTDYKHQSSHASRRISPEKRQHRHHHHHRHEQQQHSLSFPQLVIPYNDDSNQRSQIDHATSINPKYRKRRTNNRMTMSYDPMIQTISGGDSMIQTISGSVNVGDHSTSTTESHKLPSSLSLSLMDTDTNASLEHPKLHRRRSKNNLVEEIVSKAVENLASGKKKTSPQNSPRIPLMASLSPSSHLQQNKNYRKGSRSSSINSNSSNSSDRNNTSKYKVRGRTRKRMSDTGILGQIGCFSPSQFIHEEDSVPQHQQQHQQHQQQHNDQHHFSMTTPIKSTFWENEMEFKTPPFSATSNASSVMESNDKLKSFAYLSSTSASGDRMGSSSSLVQESPPLHHNYKDKEDEYYSSSPSNNNDSFDNYNNTYHDNGYYDDDDEEELEDPNDDSSYENQKELHTSESFVDSYDDNSNEKDDDDDDDDSIEIVPERLWNGSVLQPNGKLTAPDTLQDSFNGEHGSECESEGESTQTECEEGASVDSSSHLQEDSLQHEHEYSNVNKRMNESWSEEEVQISSPVNHSSSSSFVVATEVVNLDTTDDHNDHHIYCSSSDYSTDTDHETAAAAVEADDTDNEDENEELDQSKTASPTHYPPPTTASTLSSASAKQPNRMTSKKQTSMKTKQHSITPRFKVNSLSLCTEKKTETPRTTTSFLTATTITSTISRHEIVKPKKWSLGSQIGAGSFGVVHVGMNDLTGNLMAVKVLQNVMPRSPDTKSNQNSIMRDLQREIDLMRSLSHPNIVRYFGTEQKKSTLYIFQEWVPGGSVSSLLRKFGPFTISVVRRYLYQILQGLLYLHSNHILHRDIKGGNILVDDRGTIKLADFGASKQLIPSSSSLAESHDNTIMMQSMTIKGTPYFMAPEVFEQRYNKKADIWSVGGVILQMISGQAPWKILGFQSPMSLFYHLKSTEGPPPVDVDIGSSSLKRIVEQCFEREVEKRPGARELLEYDFFQEDDDYDEDDALTTSQVNGTLEHLSDTDSEQEDNEEESSYHESSSPKHDPFVSAMKNITNKDKTNAHHSNHNKESKASNAYSSMSSSNVSNNTRSEYPMGQKTTLNRQTSKSKATAKAAATTTTTSNYVCDDWPTWAKVQAKTKTSNTSNPFHRRHHRKENDSKQQSSSKYDANSVSDSLSQLSISSKHMR